MRDSLIIEVIIKQKQNNYKQINNNKTQASNMNLVRQTMITKNNNKNNTMQTVLNSKLSQQSSINNSNNSNDHDHINRVDDNNWSNNNDENNNYQIVWERQGCKLLKRNYTIESTKLLSSENMKDIHFSNICRAYNNSLVVSYTIYSVHPQISSLLQIQYITINSNNNNNNSNIDANINTNTNAKSMLSSCKQKNQSNKIINMQSLLNKREQSISFEVIQPHLALIINIDDKSELVQISQWNLKQLLLLEQQNKREACSSFRFKRKHKDSKFGYFVFPQSKLFCLYQNYSQYRKKDEKQRQLQIDKKHWKYIQKFNVTYYKYPITKQKNNPIMYTQIKIPKQTVWYDYQLQKLNNKSLIAAYIKNLSPFDNYDIYLYELNKSQTKLWRHVKIPTTQIFNKYPKHCSVVLQDICQMKAKPGNLYMKFSTIYDLINKDDFRRDAVTDKQLLKMQKSYSFVWNCETNELRDVIFHIKEDHQVQFMGWYRRKQNIKQVLPCAAKRSNFNHGIIDYPVFKMLPVYYVDSATQQIVGVEPLTTKQQQQNTACSWVNALGKKVFIQCPHFATDSEFIISVDQSKVQIKETKTMGFSFTTEEITTFYLINLCNSYDDDLLEQACQLLISLEH